MRLHAICTLLLLTTASAQVSLGRQTLQFEENRGQAAPEIRYLARCSGYTLFLTDHEAVLAGADELRLRFAGAQPAPAVVGRDQLPGIVSYFRGNDPERWVSGAPTFEQVTVRDLYPGVDLVYYGTPGGELEFDLQLAPGADSRAIEMEIEGACSVTVDDRGALVLEQERGTMTLQAPQVFQGPAIIVSRYRLIEADGPAGARVGFELGAHDRGRPIVIDPVLSYSTYLGGGDSDRATGVAVDAAGNTFVTGYTDSTDFPTVGAIQGVPNGSDDAFVTKLDPTGSTILYSTYLGGSGGDSGNAIALDGTGSAHIIGSTQSADFPTANPYQGAPAGGAESFIAKLDPAGSTLVYSTYIGGARDDYAAAIAVDIAGNAIVAGATESWDFPTANPMQGATGALWRLDGFITKLDPSGATLIYSTYLGGNRDDSIADIALDPAGNVLLVGRTDSTDFPTVNPLQATVAGRSDVFVARMNAAGTALIHSTYLGGSGDEYGYGIAVDPAGNISLAGNTRSSDFPTVNPLQGVLGGGAWGDAFAAKLDPTGTTILYSTYLGGVDRDEAYDVDVDAAGNSYVTGYTKSPDFPTASPRQGALGGGADVFVTKIDPTGSTFVYSTYLGGALLDWVSDIVVDAAATAHVVGSTQSTDYPTANPLQGTIARPGPSDAFISRLAEAIQVRSVVPTLATVTQGMTAIAIAVDIENIGPNAVTVDTIAPTFADAMGADLVADYTVTPAPSNPTSIAGGATESFDFAVDVSPSATVGAVTLHAAASMTDTVTMAVYQDTLADTPGAWDVVAGEALVRVVDAVPDVVLPGDTGIGITVTVENTGINSIDVGAVALSFAGTVDRTAEYVVTPDPGNPTSIAGGATEPFTLTVEVLAGAALELITIDASFTGSDGVTAAPRVDPDADVTDTWNVLACFAAACGDCNGDGSMTVVDSLLAAQSGVALIVLTPDAFSNCNVTGALEPDPGAAVDVLDALLLAQLAAGLPVVVACC